MKDQANLATSFQRFHRNLVTQNLLEKQYNKYDPFVDKTGKKEFGN